MFSSPYSDDDDDEECTRSPPWKLLRSICGQRKQSYWTSSRNYDVEDYDHDSDSHEKKNEEITAITASLGEVQTRLSHLHDKMASDRLVEKALSDPMSHRTLLARLSDVAQLARLGEIARQDKSFRKAFLTVAHELEDIIDSDDSSDEEEEEEEDDEMEEDGESNYDESDDSEDRRERQMRKLLSERIVSGLGEWEKDWGESSDDDWFSDDDEYCFDCGNYHRQQQQALVCPSVAAVVVQSTGASSITPLKSKQEADADTEDEGDDTDLQILEESKQHLQQIDKEIEIPVLTETASREEVEDLWEAIEDEIDQNDEQTEKIHRAIHILTGSLNVLREFTVNADNGGLQNSAEEETANFIREAETLLHYLKLDYKFVPLKAIRGKIKEIKVRLDKITANDPIRKERRQELEAMYENTEQRCTDLVFDKFAFQQLAIEVSQDYKTDLRHTKEAMEVLQVAAEAYLVELFSKAESVAKHGHRTFVNGDDLNLLCFARGDIDVYGRKKKRSWRYGY
jgi:histone H3/H4